MRLHGTNVDDAILSEGGALGQCDLRSRRCRCRSCLNEEGKKGESSGELDLHVDGRECTMRSWALGERFPVQFMVEFDRLLYSTL